MKVIYLVTLSLLVFSMNVSAQFEDPETTSTQGTSPTNTVKPNSSIKDKLVLGGGLDLQFGSITSIGLTPLVAYAVNEKFLVGGIFTYRYFNNSNPGYEYTTSTYGVAPFARYFLFQGFFVHGEYEMLNGEFYRNQGRTWVNSLFAGAGYASRIGKNGFAGLYVLWNLTEDPNYIIYNNPVFRVSFGVGL